MELSEFRYPPLDFIKFVVTNTVFQKSQSCVIAADAARVRSAMVMIMPDPVLTPDFWESYQLGVKPVPKCDRCRRCQQTGECSGSHVQHSLKDQAGLDLIKSPLKQYTL